MALAAVNLLSQLAINVLVVVLLLLVLVPGPNRRQRVMTACALFLIGGVLFLQWRPSPRDAVLAPPAPEVPAPPAPVLPRPAVPPVPQPAIGKAASKPSGAIAIDLGDLNLPDLGEDVSSIVSGLWPARAASGEDAPQSAADLQTRPAAQAESSQQLNEALTVLTRRSLTDKLSSYFDELVRRPSTAARAQELRDLHTALEGLSTAQRRHLAEEAAALRDLVASYQLTLSADGHAESRGLKHYAIEAEIPSARIVELAQAEARGRRGTSRTPWHAGVAVVGVVIVAAAVLKRVAGRGRVRHI